MKVVLSFILVFFTLVLLSSNLGSNAYGENSPASWKGKVSLDTQEPCLGFSCTIVDQENGEFEFTYDGVWNISGHGTFNQKVSVSGSECNGQGSTSGTLRIEGYVDQGQIRLQIWSDPGIVEWTNHCIYPYGDQSTNHLVELQSIWYGEGAYILPLSSNASIDKTKDLDFGTGHWVLTISSDDFSSDVSNSGESPTKTPEKPKLVPSNDFEFDIDVSEFKTMKQDSSIRIPVQVTLVKGEPAPVSLSTTTWQDSLEIHGWFEPDTVTPTQSTTLIVKTSCKTPPDNYQFYVNGISTSGNGASSTDIVTVTVESSDCDTQTPTKKITAESSFGSLQINSPVFSASKYSSETITVSGGVTTILRGTPITLQIIKPDNTIETQGIIVKKDGDFSVPVIVNSNWPLGNYAITASYGDNEIGTVYFQVVGDSKTTAQTAKTLTYENKQYGFSINYPSTWQKNTALDKDSDKPNRMTLATFLPPQQDGLFMIGLAENDPYLKGLDGQQLVDTIKQELTTSCTDPDCTDLEFLSSGVATHVNGYKLYYVTFTSVLTIDESTMNPMFVYAIIPDGDDFWLMSTAFFNPDTFDQLSTEITPMAESFTIFDYEELQQFSLHSKASQKNYIVYLAIKNPKDSSDDIYGIKLTNINGKITNFLKIKGWNYVRVGTDSVMYQTTSSPLTPSDLIKIALKVDSKKTEIKWEAFSKDKTSLGTGSVKP